MKAVLDILICLMCFALQAVTVELSEKDVIVKAVDTSQVINCLFILSSHNKSSSLDF